MPLAQVPRLLRWGTPAALSGLLFGCSLLTSFDGLTEGATGSGGGPGHATASTTAVASSGPGGAKATTTSKAASTTTAGPPASSGSTGAGAGGGGSGGSGGAGGTPTPLPALPLSTSGRWIVDANAKRFKLAGVGWYGAEEKDHVVAGLDHASLASIAKLIHSLGFNSVRLPWSNEMVEQNPVVADTSVSMNPQLMGLHALEVLDAVIDALAFEGLVVILDNHVSRADWCFTTNDDNGLWYSAAYPESSWLADWKAMATRYLGQPAVVAAELRNELRKAQNLTPVWGGMDPSLDWHAAAERGGNAVLSVNPNLLIAVQGVDDGLDLSGAYALPVQLAVSNRLVYAPHDYAAAHPNLASAGALATDLGNKWGYLLVQNEAFTAPVWVSEYYTCHTSPTCADDTSGNGFWFQGLRKYLVNADIDWSYWSVNGTQARGTGRTFGAEDTFGLLTTSWDGTALEPLMAIVQALEPATQGP